ncbi:hypothetical protein BD410DRAFT_716446 [Rickenella mellea]|uniref:Uncharacterized protein n=1 Tax=Rickenella mellea TaxID=50990 RepID=A0A4Y7QE44_9AGAM|nr:hypothetical protein BD410DRAFT_716446 [Rickenella mellea]
MKLSSPSPNGSPAKHVRPFLHPNVSRLRSVIPHPSPNRMSSVSSFGTLPSYDRDAASPSPSHFSTLSRHPSQSELTTGDTQRRSDAVREAFRWTILREIGDLLYTRTPSKASAVLGSDKFGSPTVLSANGYICIGTETGRVCVFDFKQQLRCVCGGDITGKQFGPVTALSLSHDHTFIAAGHAYGHIQLFDINRPQTPARTVNPTNMTAVASGRQEGHLQGSRIVRIGFISGRHTAIVSADDQGLAFYHSLGKALFFDANDTLRILGKYPEEDRPTPTVLKQPATAGNRLKPGSRNGTATPASPKPRSRPSRTACTILAMAPLPLGSSRHPTDAYQLVALLTSIKLVVVGLKPSPKTWFRHHREGDEAINTAKSKWKGCLAWFPSVTVSTNDHGIDTPRNNVPPRSRQNNAKELPATTPLLACSWGRVLNVFRAFENRVSRKVRNEKTGKLDTVEEGKIVFEQHGQIILDSSILAIQWLNANQIIVSTARTLDVYDIRPMKLVERALFDSHSLVSPTPKLSSTGGSADDSYTDVAQSLRTYKGKIFVLRYEDVRVGTLMSWADRILSFVEAGDFLSAIDLTKAYFLGQAEGNKNGLPEDPEAMRNVTGRKLRELMTASTRYLFSEDRLFDATHVTPDNRGVDRTSLFEQLVTACAQACIALGDFDFLFEDLFQSYDDAGILPIYLEHLEPFVLDSSIHAVPPRVTQRFIAMYEQRNDLDNAERIIWHIDPDCLDINQAISLCQDHHLYDALIYVYTKALRDYVSPVVELLGLIRKVLQGRKDRPAQVELSELADDTQSIETIVPNAYKIYPYLSDILSGLTYPSERPLDADEALQAQKDVYTFLFYGRSSVWPPGGGGKLVLTADEEGGVEPTYPYARLLLRFDAEAFLHSLDIAFEHGYLNDESQGVSRQVVVKVLLEIMSSPDQRLSSSDLTFLNIFLARNIPKYPQFIHLPPRSLQNILIGLATDSDLSTREDRQLAAEYLLSVYTPHHSDHIMHLFEEAGFFRILQSWYRQEKQWNPLIETYLRDPDLLPQDIFSNITDTLDNTLRFNRNELPKEVIITILDALPQLLQSAIPETALLVDKYLPDYHSKALGVFDEQEDHKRLAYLRCLLGPHEPGEEHEMGDDMSRGPSLHVGNELCELYMHLLCRYEPDTTIDAIKYLPQQYLESDAIIRICEDEKVFDTVIWLLNRLGNPLAALDRVETYNQDLIESVQTLDTKGGGDGVVDVGNVASNLQKIGHLGVVVCLEHSEHVSQAEVPVEDLWFKLLRSQIFCAQTIASTPLPQLSDRFAEEEAAVTTLRNLVQKTFASLVSISSTKAVLFPRLFKRLVDSTAVARLNSGNSYSEFRTILTGMLESYRSEEDLLVITERLVASDLFDNTEELSKERMKGWKGSDGVCAYCRQSFSMSVAEGRTQPHKIVVSRSGIIYHDSCLQPRNVE